MTKKQIQNVVEKLVERIAVAHGATIGNKRIKVGGRETDSAVAEGGLFDLDACRGLLARALEAKAEELVGFFAATRPAAAAYELNGEQAAAPAS